MHDAVLRPPLGLVLPSGRSLQPSRRALVRALRRFRPRFCTSPRSIRSSYRCLYWYCVVAFQQSRGHSIYGVHSTPANHPTFRFSPSDSAMRLAATASIFVFLTSIQLKSDSFPFLIIQFLFAIPLALISFRQSGSNIKWTPPPDPITVSNQLSSNLLPIPTHPLSSYPYIARLSIRDNHQDLGPLSSCNVEFEKCKVTYVGGVSSRTEAVDIEEQLSCAGVPFLSLFIALPPPH